MAAVIGDYIPDTTSRFHAMIANPPPPQHHHRHSHPHHPHPHDASPYRSAARPRQSSSTSRPGRSASGTAGKSTGDSEAGAEPPTAIRRPADSSRDPDSAARIPSPPPSSSPAAASRPALYDNGKRASMASDMVDTPSAPLSSASRIQQPSPSSDDAPIHSSSAAIPRSAPQPQPQPLQTVIHLRDLAHVRNLAQSGMLPGDGAGVLNDPPLQQLKYEISAMPIGDVIEMVAALLTKITTTNDLQHDAMQRNATHQQQANQSSDASGSQISPMGHSVLAFHGKNVPAITIHSYLSRIHKYCPTTFEVFLSLLVYFDRMTDRVNDLVAKSEKARKEAVAAAAAAATDSSRPSSSTAQPPAEDVTMRDSGPGDNSDETDSDLADDDDDDEVAAPSQKRDDPTKVITAAEEQPSINGPSTYFVVDSFNIHRLIIAGVTCSSKFFSDVFYTNSRYAKVGGLPLAELNHLELQFLVLNDFRLAIPVEDLEVYATMLVEFYAREVIPQRPGGSG